jgi:quercetin dioxygenase-like cupin family protein
VIINPEPVEKLRIGASTGLVRLRSADTGGELSIVEFHMPAGTLGAAPHIHDGHAEDFVIMSGEITFDVLAGGQLSSEAVGAGGTVTVPPGTVHGFRNDSAFDAVIVGLFRPGGYEEYFRELHEMTVAGHIPEPEDMARLRARFRSRTL